MFSCSDLNTVYYVLYEIFGSRQIFDERVWFDFFHVVFHVGVRHIDGNYQVITLLSPW